MSERLPYKDPSLPVDERVADLLSRMTFEEKVAQLGCVHAADLAQGLEFDESAASARIARGIGQVARSAVLYGRACPRDVARFNNALQRFLREKTRLGIPAIVHEECCAGFMARRATCFPQIIGLASTFQPELAQEMTQAIRRQMRAVGAHLGLAPVLDVVRDPRYGRVEETFGEDPYLAAAMGLAYIRGLQGADGRGVLATGKHFVGYGMPEGGLNWAPSHITPRELAKVYLFPFEAAVKEGKVGAIMNAYQEIDGIPCAANRELLRNLLRLDWRFEGVVVSDYNAIPMLATYHLVAKDKEDAACQALVAGIDVELPEVDCYGEPLLNAVRRGRVSVTLVEEAVRRILRQKFELGLFENPFVDEATAEAAFDTPEDRALARRIAEQSLVLLRNEGGLLPLPRDVESIAVIGPNAHSLRNLHGDYHFAAHIEVLREFGRLSPEQLAQMMPPPPPDADPMEAEAILYREHYTPFVSILEGIRELVSPATKVIYAKGCDIMGEDRSGFAEAIAAARSAKVAIVVVGERAGLASDCTSGEFRDRASLGLPGVQEELVRAIVETGTPTVVVLVNGRPLAIPWIAEHAGAILEAWFPGEEGGRAVAAALFGLVNPGGKLPMSFPRSVGQVPVFYSHKPSGGRSFPTGHYVDLSAEPLFPFGHGLSYTRFAYEALSVEPAEAPPTGQVHISFWVQNVGERAGDEVAQLYLQDKVASVTRPVKQLRRFARLHLEPAERKLVRFTLDVRELAFYDREMRYVVEPGEVAVYVGSSSQDIRLTGSFTITGETVRVHSKVFAGGVSISS